MVVHSLSELKALFNQHNIKDVESDGVSLKVKKDTYTMAFGEIYKNGKVTNLKQIFPKKSKRKK